MSKRGWSTTATIGLFLSLGLGVTSKLFVSNSRTGVTPSSVALSRAPSIVLWAWERPENLDFIEPERIAVAYLAKTISLRDDHAAVRPRLQPLSVPSGTKMIAVTRIESDRGAPPALSPSQLEIVVREICELSNLPNVVAVQVDFDATRSEREFYRKAILRLRERLPESTALSITALASWCKGDDWLSTLPIDEAVPMLFRMGIDKSQMRSQLESGSTFPVKPCQTSAGVSIDEPLAMKPRNQRLYIFNPQPWSAASFKTALEIYNP